MPAEPACNAQTDDSGPDSHGYYHRACHLCGAPFKSRRADAHFCPGTDHRKQFHGRVQERSREAYPVLIAWRLRPRRAGAWAELTRMVDRWLREDRETKGAKHGQTQT